MITQGLSSNPDRRHGATTAILLLLAVVLGAWSMTIHTSHNGPHAAADLHTASAGATATDTATARPILHAGLSSQPEEHHALLPAEPMLDCPLPSMLTPASDTLHLLPATEHTHLQRAYLLDARVGLPLRSVDRPHRPPGPTRQALLQQFRL